MSLTTKTLNEQAFLLLAAARSEEEAKAVKAAFTAHTMGKSDTLKSLITLEVKSETGKNHRS